ncbi:hypothetical protein [Rhodobacter lacus]|uniref:Uncharacterized protein n=1 Tax=Rhodobacter lacus TaxID=1641972 RepID=A0ABW5ACS7_9RHOB
MRRLLMQSTAMWRVVDRFHRKRVMVARGVDSVLRGPDGRVFKAQEVMG